MLKITKRPSGKTVMEERKTIETFQEYYVEDEKAMLNILNMHASNPEDVTEIFHNLMAPVTTPAPEIKISKK
jgi:hypothetical protein